MSDTVLVSRADLAALMDGFLRGVWVRGAGVLPELEALSRRAFAARDNLYRALHSDPQPSSQQEVRAYEVAKSPAKSQAERSPAAATSNEGSESPPPAHVSVERELEEGRY